MDRAAPLTIEPDDWSQLSRQRRMPEIDVDRMRAYRLDRVREQIRRAGAALGVFVSPVSLRYAVDHRGYALFNAHIPSSYLFVAPDGPVVLREGMTVCIESYVGAVGERDGVKVEQQVLVTKDGYELLSTFPLEDALLE